MHKKQVIGCLSFTESNLINHKICQAEDLFLQSKLGSSSKPKSIQVEWQALMVGEGRNIGIKDSWECTPFLGYRNSIYSFEVWDHVLVCIKGCITITET